LGTRQHKLARQLQKDLGDILDSFSREEFPHVLVSLMEVSVTSDLGVAKLYVSIFNAKSDQVVMDWLNANKGQIRHALAQRIKNQVRKIPELFFYPDHTQEKAERIEKLLNEIKKDEEGQGPVP